MHELELNLSYYGAQLVALFGCSKLAQPLKLRGVGLLLCEVCKGTWGYLVGFLIENILDVVMGKK